jgi:hypothetical protein
MQSLRNMLFHELSGGSKGCKGKEMHTVYAEAGFLCLGMRHFAQQTFRCFAAEQRSRTGPLLERSHGGVWQREPWRVPSPICVDAPRDTSST